MKKITFQTLKNRAFFYLERYDANSQKLKTVLLNRLKKEAQQGNEIPPEAPQWIQQIIEQMQQLNYINDARYTENTIRRLNAAGKSKHFIMGKLRQNGLTGEQITPYLTNINELASARIFKHKKHLGTDYQKDLAKLARAGFSFEIAQQVLEEK